MAEYKPRGALSYEEIEALLNKVDILTTIKQVDLEKVEEVLRKEETPMEEYLRKVREDVRLDKELRPGKGNEKKREAERKKRKKQHHSTLRKKERVYHQMVRKGRRKEKRIERLEKDGWWGMLYWNWRNKGLDIQITKEEWEERITPLLGEGMIPSVWRYDTGGRTGDPLTGGKRGGPISWDNIYVRDRETGETLWDCKQEALVAMGACLVGSP